VIDQDHVAVILAVLDLDDLAIAAGQDGDADIRVEIEPLVQPVIARTEA
jgi:hypothetical protein